MERVVDDASYRALLQSAAAHTADFLIGFIRMDGVGSANAGGSGTLVTIEGRRGILTASHVIENLRKGDRVGLVLPSRLHNRKIHNLSMDVDACDYAKFLPSGELCDGPDLGLIFPPADVLATIEAKKIFYNLSKRQKQMLDKPEPLEHGIWALAGIPGEWVSDGEPDLGFSEVKVFRGMLGAGKVTTERIKDEFDYIVFEALYNASYVGPESYEGFSGGGLWQLTIKADGDNLLISDFLLSGVAFYQSSKKRNEEGEFIREIICHGRKSIYEKLIEKASAG